MSPSPSESVLGVAGRLQVSEGVAHLNADSVFRPDLSRSVIEVGSRNFH